MEPVVKKGDMAQAGRKKLDDFRRKKAEAAAKAKGKGVSSAKGSSSKVVTPSDNFTSTSEAEGVSEAQPPGKGTEVLPEGTSPLADIATTSTVSTKGNGSLKEGGPPKSGRKRSKAEELAREGTLGAMSRAPSVVGEEGTASDRRSSNGSAPDRTLGGVLRGLAQTPTVNIDGVTLTADGATRPPLDGVMAAERGGRRDEGAAKENFSAEAPDRGGAGNKSSVRSGDSKFTHSGANHSGEPSVWKENEKQALERERASSSGASNSVEAMGTFSDSSQTGKQSSAPGPSSSSANGMLDRSAPTSVTFSPSPAPQNAPPKASVQPETPAAIPLLSPSLPSPSPSPQNSFSSETPPRFIGNQTPVTSTATPVSPPMRATLEQSPPQMAPQAAVLRPPQNDQEALSRPAERISMVLHPASASGEAEILPNGVRAEGATELRVRQTGTARTGPASSSAPAVSESPPVSNQNGPHPALTEIAAPSVLATVVETSDGNSAPAVSSEGGRSQPGERTQEVVVTPGDAVMGEVEPIERFSARLGAVTDTPQMASARRRLDAEFAAEGGAGSPNAADSRVPRVQSQPSFKDFVPDDPAPLPAHRRSQTPDSITSFGPAPAGLVQTATSLRSSLANLFAPSARAAVPFPRPEAGEPERLPGEITAASASAGSAPWVVLPGTTPSESQPSVPAALPASTASRPQPSDSQPSDSQPTVSQPPPAALPSNAATANSARYSRSPIVPCASQPVGSQLTDPALPVSTQPTRAVLKLGPVNGEKVSTRKGGAEKPTGPPFWSRSKSQTAAIDLNPSVPATESFTFPSSTRTALLDKSAERQPSHSERPLVQPAKPTLRPASPKGHAPSQKSHKSPSRPGRRSQPSNGGLEAPPPPYRSPPLSPRPRPPTPPLEEAGVVVGPRKSPTLSPRRRPRSPKPEPLSSATIPSLSIDSPPPLRPVSTNRASDNGRRSSGSSVESSNGTEKPFARISQNGVFAGESNSTDVPKAGLTLDFEAIDSQSFAAKEPAAKPVPKPAPKRSLLQSALAPPQNPKPLIRSSFPGASEPDGTDARDSNPDSAPARRSFTLPSAGQVTTFGSASAGVNRSPRSENGSGRLSRLPSMPAVEEAGPSPGHDRGDGSDFALLEQHIQDLTQEKFALQRGAETARVLAASLEEENSQLTEDFNRQAHAVQALRSEVERQQAEIKAQQMVAEAMSEERDRLQRENAGALEQAQVMGREVVHLEEQVMRLRSSELKLRQELEGTQSGYESARRQLTTLAADRASLRQMMDALQEERRLLVAKLRQLGVKNALEDVRTQVRTGTVLLERLDATTSTDDLPGPSADASGSTTQTGHQSEPSLAREYRTGSSVDSPAGPDRGSGSQLHIQVEAETSVPPQRDLPGSNAERVAAAVAAAVRAAQNSPTTSRLGRSASGAAGGSLPLPTGLPEDQARVIENVNRLMDELAAERRAMAAALRAETGACEELRVSNSELTRKLAVMTDQLRALDRGEREGPSSTAGTGPDIPRVDEGDEVVERVLGWISNFFAGR